MTMNLFSQFASPYMLGVPLALVAMALPTLALFPHRGLIPSRLTMLQNWFLFKLTKQLFTPLNKTGHTWSLPISALMVYLLMLNLLGLLPYTFTPTTQLSMNMGLAFPLWLATVLVGLRHQLTTALAHMLPLGTPGPLIPILILIETVSLIIRPLALGVRLTANLTAGHLLMTLISITFLALLPTMPTMSFLTLALLLLLTALEVAVAMIQAYVFTLLLSLYLQENT